MEQELNITSWLDIKLRSPKYPNGLVRQIYFKVLQFSIEENNCGRPMSNQQQISFCEPMEQREESQRLRI